MNKKEDVTFLIVFAITLAGLVEMVVVGLCSAVFGWGWVGISFLSGCALFNLALGFLWFLWFWAQKIFSKKDDVRHD